MSSRKKPNTLLLNTIIKYDMNKRSQPISKKYFFHPPGVINFWTSSLHPQKHFICHEESRGKRILTLSALSRSCQFLPLSDRIICLAGHIPSLNINNLTHTCIFQALSCWFRLPVKRTNFCCALKHFFPQSSSKHLFHDTSGGTFRIIIAYQESIIASFEDIWQSKLSQNVDRRWSW